MLIISPFKDYYDVGLAFGVDQKQVYRRMPEAVRYEAPGACLASSVAKSVKANGLTLKRTSPDGSYGVVVGFCGRVFVGVALTSTDRLSSRVSRDPLDPSVQNFDNLSIYLSEHQVQMDADRVEGPLKAQAIHFLERHGGPRKDWSGPIYYFGEYADEALFKAMGVPIFALVGNRLVKNPKVSQTGLPYFINGIEAFASLSMFLPKLSPPESPEPRTDVEVAHSKGFDKNSFRRGKNV